MFKDPFRVQVSRNISNKYTRNYYLYKNEAYLHYTSVIISVSFTFRCSELYYFTLTMIVFNNALWGGIKYF